MNNPTIQETLLGVDFYIETFPVDGWWIDLSVNPDGATLYSKRVIADSLYEAVCGAVWAVWGDDMEKHQDFELPNRICSALGITEPEYEEA